MVTYEQARETVRRATEPSWPADSGTYCLDDRRIVQNDEVYVFEFGAREFLVGGDSSYEYIGALPVVVKATGELEFWPSPKIGMDPTITATPNPEPTLDA